MSDIQYITAADIRYKIVGKDETQVSIFVNYWADGYDFKMTYPIDLPIDDETGAIPTGDALKDLIMHFAPIGQLNALIARFKAAVLVDFSEIDQLIAQS